MKKFNNDFLKGRDSALLTKHKKENVIQPLFEATTGCNLIVVSNFDTDVFGTFTGDVERTGTQIEAARFKALKGMEIAGTEVGLASEGSFGPHPYMPFLPWNKEIVILVDKRENIELVGEWASTDTNYMQKEVKSVEELLNFSESVRFPEHYIVVKPKNSSQGNIYKGLSTKKDLILAFELSMNLSNDSCVLAETDMRAHANPIRMANIKRATENLLEKINSKCPECNSPGFWLTKQEKGLLCEHCSSPTAQVITNIFTCLKCDHKEVKMYPNGIKASAAMCPYCNP